MDEKLWLKIPEVFKKYKTSYSELITEITYGNIKANIVGGQVYFNDKELKKCLKLNIRNTMKTAEEDTREIVILENIKPIHFEKRTPEKFKVKDKAWISWDGKKAIPVTVTEVTEHNYSIKIEKPFKNKGNQHSLFLDEVRSTPELACMNCVTS